MARHALQFLLLLCGACLQAQGMPKMPPPPMPGGEAPRLPPEMQLTFVAPEEATTWFETWRETAADGTPGPFVIALPFAVRLEYREPASSDGKAPLKRLELLADQSLVWFTPDSPEKAQADPLGSLASGVKRVQFYGEGNVWLEYTVGDESFKLRADRVFLDFERGRVTSFSLTGKLDNVRAHSGPDQGERDEGPVRVGIGAGNAADKARGAPEDIGAPPGQSDAPQPGGQARALPQERGQRMFMRAKTLRIISLSEERKEVELEQGSVSSSSLAVASYSLASERLRIVIRKDRGTIYTTRPSVRILDWPLLTLPVEEYRYDLDSIFPVRQFDFVSNSRFGLGMRTYVDAVAAYDFFADPEPPFHPLALGPQVDYFSKRGLGLGVNLEWGGIRAFKDHGRAEMRLYGIRDRGDDRKRARDLGFFPLEREGRGRLHADFTKNFGAGWQLDAIFGYYTDRNFRREFYENEYDANLPSNTFLLLTKRYGEFNAFLLAAPRINEFENRTEYLPTLGFDVSRTRVGDFGLQFSGHTEVSLLRFRPADNDPRRAISAVRVDSANWFNLPLDLRWFTLDPFAGARATVARDFLTLPQGSSRPGLSPDGTFPGLAPGVDRRSGLLYRLLPFFGLHAQTFFTGVFPQARVPGLGIDGLRHVVMPYVRYTNVAFNSLDEIRERAFIPFDEVDVLDEFHEVRLGLRNRLQTRQGSGENRRTVDYLDLMVELPVYPHPRRDNNNRVFGTLELAGIWRPAPGFAIATQGFFDLYEGTFIRANASFNVDFTDVIRGSLYYRLLRDVHQVVGINVELTLSEVYGVRFQQEYDLELGKFRDTRIELTRDILEAFTIGFVFVRDASQGDLGFYVSLAATFAGPGGSGNLLR